MRRSSGVATRPLRFCHHLLLRRGIHPLGGEFGAGADAEAFGVVDGAEAVHVFLAGAAGENVVEFFPAGDFLGGGAEALFDFVGGVLRAALEAAAQFLDGGWDDEDGDEAAGEERLGGGGFADSGGALHVDVEDDILALVDEHDDVAAAGAVVVAVDEGVLKKFSGGEGGVKLRGGQEAVVHAVLFAGAGRAAGAGDEAFGARDGVEQRVAQRGFSAAGRSGKNKNQAGTIRQCRESRHEQGRVGEPVYGFQFTVLSRGNAMENEYLT